MHQFRGRMYLAREEAGGVAVFSHAQGDQIERQGGTHRMPISGSGRFGPEFGGNRVDIRRGDRDPIELGESSGPAVTSIVIGR